MRLVAKTLMGLEEVLAEELKELGASDVVIGKRVVEFEGDQSIMIKATYGVRTAIRILKPIFKFKFHSKKDFYNKVYRHNWINILNNDQSIAIDSIVHSRFFNNTQYVSQFTKDGIVDYFNKKTGKRPNVELNRPDIRFHVHIVEDVCEISLDTSGFSLHKRSYKTAKAFAPLSEVLAAGMVKLSGWDQERLLIDPMCGSGTIIIEAAMLQRNIPAQYLNHRFCFQNWRDYDEDLYKQIRAEMDAQINTNELLVAGSDVSYQNVEASKINAENVLGQSSIKIEKKDFFDYKDMSSVHMIVNPPYDLRLKNDDIAAFYKEIGDSLKQQWKDCQAWIISGNIDAIKSIGLKTSKRIHLINGQIPCKFHKFELYAGSKK